MSLNVELGRAQVEITELGEEHPLERVELQVARVWEGETYRRVKVRLELAEAAFLAGHLAAAAGVDSRLIEASVGRPRERE